MQTCVPSSRVVRSANKTLTYLPPVMRAVSKYLPHLYFGLAVDTRIPASIAPSNTICHSAVFGIRMMIVSPGCRPVRRRDAANRWYSWRVSSYPTFLVTWKFSVVRKNTGNIRHWLYDQTSAYVLTPIFMPSSAPPIDTSSRFSYEFPHPNYVYEFIYIEPFSLD